MTVKLEWRVDDEGNLYVLKKITAYDLNKWPNLKTIDVVAILVVADIKVLY